MTQIPRIVSVLAGGVISLTIASAQPAQWSAPHYTPIVKDAASAIRIARVMELAQRPDDQMIRSEAEWEQHCTAFLKDGVWRITNKPPSGPRVGYFTGAAVIFIGAQDGRYMGEMFAD